MEQSTYNRFKELRQAYYIAARQLAISQMFSIAGINFGYAIELSLKFLLAYNGHNKRELLQHNLIEYYNKVVDNEYIPALRVSSDFLEFINDRLNARYPLMIAGNLEKYDNHSRGYVFPIDILHCYDDFFLQLDDAIADAVKDSKCSTGFRCCRDLESITGRVFFHCNDHAIDRIEHYKLILMENRDSGDNFEHIFQILSSPDSLWNFPGLIAFRPWGPKQHWHPAEEFRFPSFDNGRLSMIAAQWQSNQPGIGMYFSLAEVVLGPGEYEYSLGQKIIRAKKDNR